MEYPVKSVMIVTDRLENRLLLLSNEKCNLSFLQEKKGQENVDPEEKAKQHQDNEVAKMEKLLAMVRQPEQKSVEQKN